METCSTYSVFGDCQLGTNCKNKHEGEFPVQKFYYAKVIDVNEHSLQADTGGTKDLYYVNSGRWHDGKASKGNFVLLQVSDLKRGDKSQARVVEVLRLYTGIPREITPDIRETCNIYKDFGDCKFGSTHCRDKHEGEFFVQKFCYAKVIDIDEANRQLRVRIGETEKNCFIPRFQWHRKGVANGDFVLLQVSDYNDRNNLKARVVEVLQNYTGETREICIKEKQTEVFTIDPAGTHRYDDSFSVERCEDHGNGKCLKIGIHIVAEALKRPFPINYESIPAYTTVSDTPKESSAFNMKEGRVVVAISAFVHFTDGKVVQRDRLCLTTVKIDANFDYSCVESVLNIAVTDMRPRDLKTSRTMVPGNAEEEFERQNELKGQEEFNQTKEPKCSTIVPRLEKRKRQEKLKCQEELKQQVKLEWQKEIQRQEKLKNLWFQVMGNWSDFVSAKYWHFYCCRYPNTWKARSVVERLMREFRLTIMQQAGPQDCIIKSIPKSQRVYEGSESVAVDKVIWTNAQNDCNSLLSIIAAGTKFERYQTGSMEKRSNLKFNRSVGQLKPTDSSQNYIPCTTPMRKFDHFVNQQVLLHYIINPSHDFSAMYSKEDLCGILNIRFRKPEIKQPWVKGMDETMLKLHYDDMSHPGGELYQLWFSDLPPAISSDCPFEIVFKNSSCLNEDYSNQDIVRWNRDEFENLREKIVSEGRAVEVKSSIVASPYAQIADGGTLLKLDLGTRLKVQISHKDSIEKNGLGIRLLMIGKNCHVCLHHIRHPELAFTSNRSDVRDLIAQRKIEALRQQTREQKYESLNLTIENIDWRSKYYAEGSFVTEEDSIIKLNDLICVRKEVTRSTDRKVDYVWCCHGVVTKIKGKHVVFSVCTLSQEDSFPTEEGKICLEIPLHWRKKLKKKKKKKKIESPENGNAVSVH